jgi:hypothetical protein
MTPTWPPRSLPAAAPPACADPPPQPSADPATTTAPWAGGGQGAGAGQGGRSAGSWPAGPGPAPVWPAAGRLLPAPGPPRPGPGRTACDPPPPAPVPAPPPAARQRLLPVLGGLPTIRRGQLTLGAGDLPINHRLLPAGQPGRILRAGPAVGRLVPASAARSRAAAAWSRASADWSRRVAHQSRLAASSSSSSARSSRSIAAQLRSWQPPRRGHRCFHPLASANSGASPCPSRLIQGVAAPTTLEHARPAQSRNLFIRRWVLGTTFPRMAASRMLASAMRTNERPVRRVGPITVLIIPPVVGRRRRPIHSAGYARRTPTQRRGHCACDAMSNAKE